MKNYKIKVFDIWEFGQRKDSEGNPHQEDSIYPPHGSGGDGDRLFLVCDGMGGHDSGEVASASVCEAMSSAIVGSDDDKNGAFTEQDFQRALSAAYDLLDERDSGAAKKMGTTMAMLKLFDKGACVAHIGDSRVYHFRPGDNVEDTEILFRTEDHSLVNDLVRIGELTEEEARVSKKKNIITRAMQPGQETRPKADIAWIEDIRPGDYFYLCTDGMIEQMSDQQLCYHFSNAGGDDETKVRNLVRATKENRDNHSAYIIHIVDVIDDSPNNEVVESTAQEEANESPTKEEAAVPPAKDETGDPSPQTDSINASAAASPSDEDVTVIPDSNKKPLWWRVLVLALVCLATYALCMVLYRRLF